METTRCWYKTHAALFAENRMWWLSVDGKVCSERFEPTPDNIVIERTTDNVVDNVRLHYSFVFNTTFALVD